MEQARIFLQQFGLLVGIGVVGVGVLIYGMWGSMIPENPKVEILKGAGTQESKGEIVVDVAGAVEKPGVYTLPSNARVGDTIVAAGGLSAAADREWVAQTLNLASEVKDGQKIFVPRRDENTKESENQNIKGATTSQGKININTASVGELDTLPGIGEVRAQAIVANRPYSSTEELVSKAKVPQSVYEKIKEQIAVY